MDKNKMSFRVLALTITSMLLLSIIAERAIAWPCSPHGPDGCGDCETCRSTGCEDDCSQGEFCCTDSGSDYCCDYDDETCCKGTCCNAYDETCCEGTCCWDETEICCDGTCCNDSTKRCCDDIGGDDDGYCCDSDEACCEGNCCDTANCYACEGGNCVYQCDPDDCEECDGEGSCVDIGCDCTIPGETWTDMYAGFNCPAENCPDPPDTRTEDDNCNNTIKIQCGPPGYCLYRYFYNTTVMSDCIWHNGMNWWQYKKTINGQRFHSARHATLHQCNSTSCYCYNKVPQCRYGCAPQGYYCWRIIEWDCINNQNESTDWLRDTTKPTSANIWTGGTSHTCPGP